MSLEFTLRLITKLTAVAVALQALEMLALRSSWCEAGVWRSSILRREYPPMLVRLIVLGEKGFARLQHLRLWACAFALVLPSHVALVGFCFTILFVCTWLTSIRWRGAFNGGSDSLTLLNLLLLSAACLSREPGLQRACLSVMALNLTLTFVISGVSKLIRKEWRSGRALHALVGVSNYRNFGSGIGPLKNPIVALIASWITIAFELLFPLAFLSPTVAIVFVGAAVVFHLLNWQLFGLNRFFHIWCATYPVVFYFASAR